MVFIEDTDLRTVIRDEFLELVTDIASEDEALQSDDVMDKAEASAISKMKSYLSKRYDVARAFDPDEEYSDKELIKEYCVDIMLHRLHARINPRKIPEIRKERYAEAMDWLEGVAMGDINPDLPELPEGTESSNDVRFGGSINESNWLF